MIPVWWSMKNNRISFFYMATSILLFVVLFAGGVYGVYVSIGLKFMRSNIENIAGNVAGNVTENASNVSYGGMVNFSPNMTGVIVLSALLVLLSVFDFIALIKQVVFFKQFKVIRESSLEKKIESKVKSKSSVIVFAFLIDILSILAGVVGLFINMRATVAGGVTWVLYLIDILVVLLALVSLILLIIKIKQVKRFKESQKNLKEQDDYLIKERVETKSNFESINSFNIDKLEYILLKIKHLKSSRIITDDEYKIIRERLIGADREIRQKEIIENKNKACD